MNPLILSVGIGLFVSLLFSELFGLVAGGLVVPGYLALHLNQPIRILTTLAIATMTYGISYAFSQVAILYGRRKSVFMVLVAFILGLFFPSYISPSDPWESIGLIIPGLIAIWMDRQGILETIATLLVVSVVVRLILIAILGEDLTHI